MSKADREQQEKEQFLGTYEGYDIDKLQAEMTDILAKTRQLDSDKAAFLGGYRSKVKHLKKRLGMMSDLLQDKKASVKKA